MNNQHVNAYKKNALIYGDIDSITGSISDLMPTQKPAVDAIPEQMLPAEEKYNSKPAPEASVLAALNTDNDEDFELTQEQQEAVQTMLDNTIWIKEPPMTEVFNEQTPINANGVEWEQQENKPVKPNPYLEASVMTASPQQLVLMLYDGAIRFMNQSVIFINAKKLGKAHEANMRSQDIFWELLTTLQGDTEVTNNLSTLYSFMIENLVQGNIKKDAGKIREVIELTKELRDTWQQALDSVTSQESGGAAR